MSNYYFGISSKTIYLIVSLYLMILFLFFVMKKYVSQESFVVIPLTKFRGNINKLKRTFRTSKNHHSKNIFSMLKRWKRKYLP
jgi:capsule polysaccharide export protein KpsE/RkpR